MDYEIEVGQTVTRWLAGTIPMELRVTEITGTEILCGPRGVGCMFDKATGAEIDEDLGWGPPPKFAMTGSFIQMRMGGGFDVGINLKEAREIMRKLIGER